MKGMLTGPVTVLNWSFPRSDVSRSTTAFQLALALREEVADLEKAGCAIIQVCLIFYNVLFLFCLRVKIAFWAHLQRLRAVSARIKLSGCIEIDSKKQ